MTTLHVPSLHNPMRVLWRARGSFMRLTCPLFWRRAGHRLQITGRMRLGLLYQNVTIGDDALIGHDAYLQTGRQGRIEVGDRFSLNDGSRIVASKSVTIGDNVAIGEYVSIRDQQHRFEAGHGVRDQGFDVAPVRIGNNVWIGRGCFIGPGTDIGDNTVVGANSVVHGVVPAGVLIAGAPARVRRRSSNTDRGAFQVVEAAE